MCAATFRCFLVWYGKAELLAASIIFITGVESNLVSSCRLDMNVKYGNIHQAIKIISNYLTPKTPNVTELQ